MRMATFVASTILVFSCLIAISECYPIGDRISELPGQPSVPFQQFSGYVTLHHNSFFYYFVEAENHPTSKPLVLWLNGGPGCSSVGVGAFCENGPFRPSGRVLHRNDYSWNKVANMLYLDTPIGVGFSYSTGPSSYATLNDDITAKDNLKFLLGWFLKFPHYRNSSFFITGESYAGHYVPQLAKLILEFNKKNMKINLKGIALGNPLLEFSTDYNSRAEYLWSHGLISDATYNIFTSGCNYSRYVSEYYRDSVSHLCSSVMSLVNKESSAFVDKYGVTFDVCIPSLLSQSTLINPKQSWEKIDVCVEDETINYMNRIDVQSSLHAKLVGVHKWDVCSEILDYDMLDLEIPTISIIGEIVTHQIPVLIYSGDQDSVIPLTGTRSLVDGLAKNLQLNTSIPYRVWFTEKQVGGWTEEYGKLLSFATIRGASHEVPFSQPQRSLVMFNSFLNGNPLPQTF